MAAPVPYIQSEEAALYGVSDAEDFQIMAASRIVDGYLGRPEGLLWTADANGAPAFMTNMEPSRSCTLVASVAPGESVTITLSQPTAPQAGDVIVLGRKETCVITAASGNTLTLASVQFAHAAGDTAEFGLTFADDFFRERFMPTWYVSRFPLAQIISAYAFQGPQMGWAALDPTLWDINTRTASITLYDYSLPLLWGRIRIRYLAGYSLATLPGAIKQAVANIVRAGLDTPFIGNAQMMKSGDATIMRFNSSMLDGDTKALLQPYRLMRV